MKKLVSIIVLLISLSLSSCSQDNETELVTPENDNSPNILLIIADDLGKDAINGYAEGSIKPTTPNIDAIRTNGLTFNNFWVNPTCTPTRGSIITGKYGYRTGLKGVGDEIDPSEVTLQKYINDHTSDQYATAIVGKWHLSGNNTAVNPESFGIDYYAGLIRGAVDDYYRWQLTEDGSTSLQTEYATEVFTDLAIDWVNQQSKPWFLWLAYNAPHTPFHAPPANMHSQGALPDYSYGMDPLPYYLASIEAMDYQIGRLLENIPENERENTIIILIGDNGTPHQVAQSPYTSSTVKGTLYQGGINTPMFISGKGITRFGEDDHLLTGTDLFATIAELVGINTNEYFDSKSFKSYLTTDDSPTREYQYSELKDGTEELWTISNGEYKLLVRSSGVEELYDLKNDPYEKNNLLNNTLQNMEVEAKAELEIELSNIRQ